MLSQPFALHSHEIQSLTGLNDTVISALSKPTLKRAITMINVARFSLFAHLQHGQSVRRCNTQPSHFDSFNSLNCCVVGYFISFCTDRTTSTQFVHIGKCRIMRRKQHKHEHTSQRTTIATGLAITLQPICFYSFFHRFFFFFILFVCISHILCSFHANAYIIHCMHIFCINNFALFSFYFYFCVHITRV